MLGLYLRFIPFSFLQEVLVGVQKLQDGSKGLRGHIKEAFKANSIKNEISRYQARIQGFCSKIKVGYSVGLHLPSDRYISSLQWSIQASKYMRFMQL
jgi:hypothetical protein